jgi:hypothetical protein
VLGQHRMAEQELGAVLPAQAGLVHRALALQVSVPQAQRPPATPAPHSQRGQNVSSSQGLGTLEDSFSRLAGLLCKPGSCRLGRPATGQVDRHTGKISSSVPGPAPCAWCTVLAVQGRCTACRRRSPVIVPSLARSALLVVACSALVQHHVLVLLRLPLPAETTAILRFCIGLWPHRHRYVHSAAPLASHGAIMIQLASSSARADSSAWALLIWRNAAY